MLKANVNKPNTILNGMTPLCFDKERLFTGYDYAEIAGTEYGYKHSIGFRV